MRLTHVAIASLLAFPALVALAPSAVAYQPPTCIQPCGPTVYWCVDGVKDCWRGDVCVGLSTQIPVCADIPCYSPIDCIATNDIECSQSIYVGAVAGQCNGIAYYAPCQYCAPAYSVYYCREDTRLNVECHPGNVFSGISTLLA